MFSCAGGWQVLRSFEPSSWDYKLILEKLHSEHGVQPFVTISVVTDPRRPKQSIIKVTSRVFFFIFQSKKIEKKIQRSYHVFSPSKIIDKKKEKSH